MSAKNNRLLRYLRRAGAGSLMISIIVHLIVIIIATLYVISNVHEQRKTAFQGSAAPSGAHQEVQHKVQMSHQQRTLSSANKRLAVETPNATVSLPDLPDMPSFSASGPSMRSRAGAGSGSGAGTARAPLMPAFGFKEVQPGGTLVGNFYDFKQLRTGKPNPEYKGSIDLPFDGPSGDFAFAQVDKFVVQNKWSRNSLMKYYQAPNPLYASQIYIPMTNADDAPKAYNVEKEVKSKAWMALYRGKISPPKTGVYRFVGAADDILVVQLDGRLVLDGSLNNTTTQFKSDVPNAPNYKYVGKSLTATIGRRMELRAGQFYDIKIALSEAPGGNFAAFLFIQEEGVQYEKDPSGAPILPVFRVADVKSAPPGTGDIPYMENGPIWHAQPPPKD